MKKNYTTFTVEAGETKCGKFLCDIEICQGEPDAGQNILLDSTDIPRLKKLIKFVEKQEKEWFLAQQTGMNTIINGG